MRKLLLVAVAAFVSVSAYAQGTVNFSTLGKMITLSHCEGGGPVPAGATYMAALYFAPAGVLDPSMFMQVGAAATFLAPGIIVAGTRIAPVSPPGVASTALATGCVFGATPSSSSADSTPRSRSVVSASSRARWKLPWCGFRRLSKRRWWPAVTLEGGAEGVGQVSLAHVRLARLFESRGETSEAMHWYSEIARLWPDGDAELAELQFARQRIEELASLD